MHSYLLAEQGTPIIEWANLEDLSRDKGYEFAIIGATGEHVNTGGNPRVGVA